MGKITRRIEKTLVEIKDDQRTLFSKIDNLQIHVNTVTEHILKSNGKHFDLIKQVNENTRCIERMDNDLERTRADVNWLMGNNDRDITAKIEGDEEIVEENKI